jgi:hypothetical protein
MILGFKEEFVPKVIDGSKIHTLRDGERWSEGMEINFYAKARTKDMYKFKKDGVVKSTQEVFMTLRWALEISIDDKYLLPHEIDLFIKNDGFENRNTFQNFFFAEKVDFVKKQLVHWTDFKY